MCWDGNPPMLEVNQILCTFPTLLKRPLRPVFCNSQIALLSNNACTANSANFVRSRSLCLSWWDTSCSCCLCKCNLYPFFTTSRTLRSVMICFLLVSSDTTLLLGTCEITCCLSWHPNLGSQENFLHLHYAVQRLWMKPTWSISTMTCVSPEMPS